MLTSTVFWKADRSVSNTLPNCGLVAALLTRMSRRPNCSRICANTLLICSISPIWQAIAVALPPSAMMASATPWQPSILRLETITWAPCWASSLAMASPIPRLAPETKAILPSRSNSVVLDMDVSFLVEGLFGRLQLRLGDDLQAHLLQQFVHLDELGEAFVLGLAVVVAVVDLLHDAGQAEQAVGVVEVDALDLDAGAFGVVVGELLAGQHARRIARLTAHHLHRRGGGGLDPVGKGVAQIHQRVADGGQFPVQHADDLHRVLWVEDHVIEAVVVVHDGRLGVGGRHLVFQPGLDRLPQRCVRGQGLLVARAPATDLALYIAFRFAQVAETAGGVVDVVQLDHLVDEALAQLAGLVGIEVQLGRHIGAQDDAVDPLHYIEFGADHRFVRAVHIGFRAVGEGLVELVENAVLATHIVSGFGLVAKGRTPQDEFLLGVFDQVGEVRCTAGELADPWLASQAGNVRLEVRIDDRSVELFTLADASGLVSKRHAYPFYL